jgi:23S rRNA (adenine2503-C2)-methyltransferase
MKPNIKDLTPEEFEDYLAKVGEPVYRARQVWQWLFQIKFLFALSDGKTIESVLIPETKRLTLCISTQAGCAFGCAFCATALLGLKRNLTSAEIVDQV